MRQTNRPHAEAVPLIRRASRDTFPQGKAYGRPQGSPLQRKPDHERWFGKPRRRCGTAPAAIFANPGPSGPAGIQTPTQISARRKFCLTSQVRVPRNGGPGVRRIWTRSVHPEPSPGDPLVSFPSLGKKLAARRRRNNPLRTTYPIQNLSPHPPPSGAPVPIPSVAARHLPLTRGVGPQGEG